MDTKKPIVAFRNFANAPNKDKVGPDFTKHAIKKTTKPRQIFVGRISNTRKNLGPMFPGTIRRGKELCLLRTAVDRHISLENTRTAGTSKVPYFSIDKAHVMYNAHPKLFRHSF